MPFVIGRGIAKVQSLIKVKLFLYMSRDMTKPTKWLCVQQRLRSAWAPAQSDQSLYFPHEEILGP